MIKKIGRLSLLSLVFHQAFAFNANDVVCPSVEQLKLFHLNYTETIGFDQKSQRINFSATLDEYEEPERNSWLLEIQSMQAAKEDDLEKILGESIAQLKPVSDDSFQFNSRYQYSDIIKTPVCIYVIPGNDRIYAIAKLDN